MENVRDGWMETPGRKAPKRRKTARKPTGKRKPRTDARLEQPIANFTGNVLCELCGHAVDPGRMHPHMVRFHGVAMRQHK
jgi:hypothetical protein